MDIRVIGLEIGAETMRAAVVDEKGSIYYSKELETPAQSELRFIRVINELLEDVLFHAPEAIAIGISVPGIVTPNLKMVHVLPNLGFDNVDFKKIIRKDIKLPYFLINDANAAGYAEAKFGAGADYNFVQYVKLGTGLGGGLIVNGKIYTGANGFAQEIGNMIINVEAPRPNKYLNENSFEGACSGKSLYNQAKRFGTNIHSVNNVFTESRFAPIRNVWVDNLGKGLANIYALYDPDVIILGGKVMQRADAFFDEIPEAIKKYTLPALHPHINIKKARFGETAGMIGAALYALHEYNKINENKPTQESSENAADKE